MARIRLHNEDWGFESNCFVCEPKNPSGLQLPFFHDPERGIVEAEFTLDDRFSGAPTLVHGGLSLAVLDEAQAWATIAIGHRFAFTVETTSRFLASVRLGHTYRVEAAITEQTDDVIETSGRIVDGRDKVRVESTASFAVFSEAMAARAIGQDLNETEATYLKPPRSRDESSTDL